MSLKQRLKQTVKVPIYIFMLLMTGYLPGYSQSNDDCLMCHDDPEFSVVKNGKKVSLYVTAKTLANSVHKDLECVSCHEDAAVEEFPHPEGLQPVKCSNCHDSEQQQYEKGVHGQAKELKSLYAPDCKECHGDHSVLPSSNPQSRTYKMNIPILCGKCHREGAPVARVYNISEHNILENYSTDVHGIGLYKKGLIVAATCNDCHGNHLILPHTSPNSTISGNNIAKTCMKCHTRIEQVHTKIIKGALWEEKPGAVPACTSCHIPHRVNAQNIVTNISDRECLKCHENSTAMAHIGDSLVSMKVDKNILGNSVHKNIACVKCHSDVSPNHQRPCDTAGKIDCSACHAEVASQYAESGHGQAYDRKDKNAPYCTDCHGTHNAKSRYDDTSPSYRANIPKLCGSCHTGNGKANQDVKLHQVNTLVDYSSSVHGKGLVEKGLTVSAVCTDCHSTHHILKETDERSTIYERNIPATCATCHKGIYDEYIKSDHAITKDDGKKKYPTCVDCHSSHVISSTTGDKFMDQVTNQCGSCHKETAETYMLTYHGKAHTLGYSKAAKCSDCHGSHDILNVNNPNSSVGSANIVATCQKCHPDANKRFTGYLTHATHHNKEKYGILFYTFWAMTSLLIGVFLFFGIHLVLWFPRSFKSLKEKEKHDKESLADKYYVQRFTRSQRLTHLFVIISFLMLAFTGMILKFSNMPWANFLANMLGGAQVAGRIHRVGAVITFGYFFFHLISLIRMKIRKHIPAGKFVFGRNSLMFNKQDLKDFGATIKWFIGRGPKPNYGRWTYWEKFDYMAVFWGVAVIGFSGLILWFPETFTKILPGWLINVAQIIHSDEALLAVGFIFTIHFFNTHLRPDAFPMDTVIFTGLVPFEEFKKDRPREYEELKESGRLRKVMVKKESKSWYYNIIRGFGFVFVAFGLILVCFIIYSMLFGYK
jgi:predicted CXXCH cytochrome family protein